jgi:hypothetical protein
MLGLNASYAFAQASSLVRDLRQPGVSPTPEGAFLVRQQCEMRRLGSSGWFLVFARPQEGDPLPPMIIHPCANLQAMQQLASTETENSRFLVSGQVFLFEGRNYILPTLFALDDEAPIAQTTDEPQTPSDASEDTEPTITDPEITDLIAALEEATSDEEIAANAAPAPSAAGLLREGTIIASRPGRMQRSDRGGWRLVFDSDVDDADDKMPDAPIELLPCLNLEAMQNVVESGADPVFLVSGRVFIYDGQNHLLPTLFIQQREQNTGLSTAQ